MTEGGTVTQAGVGIRPVQEDVRDEDISRCGRFARLRRLDFIGDGEFIHLPPLNSAPLETINCSRAIVAPNLPILRAMSSLKTITGKPASDYLDLVKAGLWRGQEE